MKLLIYGAGVIGSIFAAKLSLSGQEVTVLARGKRLEEIKKQGIILLNPESKQTETAKVKVIESLMPEMSYDYIFVVMQKNQVGEILKSLASNCTKNIVFVVNTASGYEEWKQIIGAERLLIGFPSAGGERKDGAVYYFIGKGLMRGFQTTTFGELSGKKTQRIAELLEMFCKAGIPSIFCSDMDSWQKTHVAMVTSIANALYGYECDNKRLSSSWKDIKEMIQGVKEGFAVLKQVGIRVTPWKLGFFYLPDALLTFAFKLFMGTKLAEVTMAKHCIFAKAEMRLLQSEFDELIRISGMKTPHIDNLRQNIL